jgi:hypothetical protein
MLGNDRLMYLILRVSVMDDHVSLTFTCLSLGYRFVNVLHIWSLFFLLNTFCHAWSGLVSLCHEFHYILGFDLYADSITLVDAT